MGKQELDNLVRIGSLKVEAASRSEFDGMVKSARRGLTDAQNEDKKLLADLIGATKRLESAVGKLTPPKT